MMAIEDDSKADRFDDLRVDRAADPAANESTRPPADEHIKLRSLWVIEVYPPGEIERLLVSMRELGWDTVTDPIEGTSIVDWLRSTRRSGMSGAWHPLYIRRKSVGPTFNSTYVAELPEHFESAVGSFCQMLPGLTVLCLQFVAEESARTDLASVLRRDYSTRHEHADKRFTHILTPDVQKRKAVERRRAALRGECQDWIRTRLPGWFSRNCPDLLPVCDVITTELAKPFDVADRIDVPEYVRLIGLDRRWRAYRSESDEWAGFYLYDSSGRNEEGTLWTLAARSSDVINIEKLSGYSQDSSGLAHHLRYLDRTLALFGVWAYVVERIARLAEMRDAIAHIPLEEEKGAAAALRQQQVAFVDANRDLAGLAGEIQQFGSSDRGFFHEVYEFRRANESVGKEGLLATARSHFSEMAAQLGALYTSTENALSTCASLINTTAADRVAVTNRKIASRVEWMTFAAVGLAIIQVLIALLSSPKPPGD